MESRRSPVPLFAAVLCGCLLGGCVPVMSLHPLYGDDDLVFEEGLLGTWAEDPNDPNDSWRFARLGDTEDLVLAEDLKDQADRLYRVTLRNEGRDRGLFVGGLVRLDGTLVLDLYPARFPAGAGDVEDLPLLFNAFFLVPVHSFVKVELSAEGLGLSLTDDDAMKKLLAAEPDAVAHTTRDDQPLLTGATAALQAFVRRFRTDERLFREPMDLTRVPERP